MASCTRRHVEEEGRGGVVARDCEGFHAEKKMPRKKNTCGTKFRFLGVKFGTLLEMDSFFLPILYLGVGKYYVLGNKIWRTLGDAYP